MVRLRENAENVAFYGGEAREFDTFETRFARIVANWWGIIRRRKKLTWFTTGYSQLAIIFPFVVAAPRYFDKAIQLGGLMQISSAFGQVQDSLSFIISSYTEIAEYQAVVQRLSGFRSKIDEIAAEREAAQPIEIERGGAGVEVDALDLNLPDGQELRPNISLAASPERSVLITGASGSARAPCCAPSPGSGRSGAAASGWPTAAPCSCRSGPICRSAPWRTPSSIPGPPPRCRARALPRRWSAVGLPQLAERLDEEGNWAQRLSIGEQQRLAFARVLLVRPEIVFLDEATSALDEAAEAALYRLLREAAWRPTIVSVGHHSTLRRFHDMVVDLAPSQVSRAAVG